MLSVEEEVNVRYLGFGCCYWEYESVGGALPACCNEGKNIGCVDTLNIHILCIREFGGG